MGDKDWRFPRTPWHHHSVPKLEQGRQEEIMIGDKNWRFPAGTPGTTILSLEEIFNPYTALYSKLFGE